MQLNSRTAKGIHNAQVALFFYCINLVLQFFSRKVFLDYLGAEVLGLNTTAQNLLGFLNLAELGIGAAVSYSLYKPLFTGDQRTINDIVSVQGWLYRKIAYIVIIAAGILMCFFPWIFAKIEVPLWYSYGSFIALLTSALLGYFTNYRQIVLSADQKEYKITYCVQGTKAVKVLLQILAIRLLMYGYVWWMILEILFAIISSIILNKIIKNEYPWLCPNVKDGQELRKKYPTIILKTRQLFFHKIAGFVLNQTTPLVIYAYVSLTLVAIYGNYLLIVLGVTSLMNALINGINAGIGNLVAEGNKERIKVFFWKITFLRMWLASIICFGMYMSGSSFISLWVGSEYLLDAKSFLLLIVIAFITLTRTNDAFIAAYGLYQDIGAPIVEACLNLGCSVLFGYFWGLNGILCGVLISLLSIVCGWKPYFLYKCGFKEPFREYIIYYGGFFILLSCIFYVNMLVVDYIFLIDIDNFF